MPAAPNAHGAQLVGAQQRPAPETGDYFKEEWLRTYSSEPPPR
jgi:hypothetical protein